jgi:protein-tyrosine-phosphatase
MHVLFLCTGNSCRSILAEAILNHLAPPDIRASSAGSHPSGAVNPHTLALLQREGIPVVGLGSRLSMRASWPFIIMFQKFSGLFEDA